MKIKSALLAPWGKYSFTIFLCTIFLAACGMPPELPTGRAITMIKPDMDLQFTNPTWNPIEDYVAIMGSSCENRCPSRIYKVDPRNGHTSLLFDLPLDYLAWTPNGMLGFHWETQDNIESIFVTPITKYNPILIDRGRIASWSPDGKHVAIFNDSYDSTTNTHRSYLEIVNLQTRETKVIYQIPSSGGGVISSIMWSSEGDKLVFTTGWSLGVNVEENHLYVIQSDGSNLQSFADSFNAKSYSGWMLDENWLYFVYGKDKELAFENIEYDCQMLTGITGIDDISISHDRTKFAFTQDGKLGIIDIDILLGPDYQMLGCPTA
jgi:Tol biopolymer transport system component